jgi:predicted transcriptional regulator
MVNELGETAKRILQFIQNNTGCHLRKIYDTIHISQGTAQYHTDTLEKIGRITYNRSGLYKHYFHVGVFQNNEKEILQILGQETSRQIVNGQHEPSQKDIVNNIGISPASIFWHIRRLIELELVDEVKEGKYKRYQLHERKVSSRYIAAHAKSLSCHLGKVKR